MKTYISTPPDNVKVYAALLTQTSTDAPTATVLENTLGGDVNFSRQSIGQYVVTCTEKLTRLKTVAFIQMGQTDINGDQPIGIIQIVQEPAQDSTLTINTYGYDKTIADDTLHYSPCDWGNSTPFYLEILVYP